MLNHVLLVGRLIENPTIKEEGEEKTTTITLAVSRAYKNLEGIYETDFINCIVYKGIAEATTEYCKKSDIVAIRGRIQTKKVDDKYIMEIVAEKVSFLSTRKEEDKGE